MAEKPLPRMSQDEIGRLSKQIANAIDQFQAQLRQDPNMEAGTVSIVVPVARMAGKWCASLTLRQEREIAPAPQKA